MFFPKVSVLNYRLQTLAHAFLKLYKMPKEKIDAFLQSYELFNKENMDENDEQKIVDYYSVLNYLCALGEVEKMYIPAVMDVHKSVFENQKLFEKKMSQDLNIKPKNKVLDIGCGRGRVAAHLAKITQANVWGLNIDDVQLENAKKYVRLSGLAQQCKFIKGSLNNPLPFEDSSFDALYQIQVITYSKNKEALFKEMYRVLKPGARLSFLDWVVLENYDVNNPKHYDLLKRIKPLIGAVNTPTSQEIRDILEKVGFSIISSQDASIGGHQADLIYKTDLYFNRIKNFINQLVKYKILPYHFKILMDRLTQDGDAFIEADRLGIVTTSYQTIAQKPF